MLEDDEGTEDKGLFLPGIFEKYAGGANLNPPAEFNYRPYMMLTTERITLANRGELQLFRKSKFNPNKQLGELVYIYGHLIHRIETYINQYRCHVGEEFLTIKDTFQNFTHGWSEREKKDFVNYRDSFERPTLYRWMDNDKGNRVVVSQEMFFMAIILRREHEPDSRMMNLSAEEVGRIAVGRPCNIEIAVNKKVYEAVLGFLHGAKPKHGGVIPILRDAPAVIKQVMKQEVPNINILAAGYTRNHGGDFDKALKIMGAVRYRDTIRTAYEQIEEYLHRQKFQDKPAGYIAQMPGIYAVMFPSKHAGDRARFFYLSYIWDLVWNSTHKDCYVNIRSLGRIIYIERLDKAKEQDYIDKKFGGR